jgi:DNA-binding CsgD family transcriptional regulator
MAERLGVEDVAVHAMDSYGAAMASAGDDTGREVLLEALDRARKADVHHEVTRICVNLSDTLLDRYEPVAALPYIELGVAVASEQELWFSRNCIRGERAKALLLLGRWDEAVADIQAVLEEPDVSNSNRSCALLYLGRIRARRGDPGAFEALDEGLELALPFAESQMLHPTVIARVEAAWLAGDLAGAAAEARAAVPLVTEEPKPWYLGELAVWAERVRVDWVPPAPVWEPFERMLRRDARAAADLWDELSCPYEAADALGDSADVDDLREALDRLVQLGARPRALQVTRRLRELGVRDLPRGPRASTLANAAGLTSRELEVAGLLAEGLTNGEIAAALVLSPKTVDHHVSAVLAKLGVPNRRRVAQAAARLEVALPSATRS